MCEGYGFLEKIDRRKLIRWECLARYYGGRGKILDVIFANPLCRDDERLKILDKLHITLEQKEFLLKVFDIDYIYIQNEKPILIEEKIKNIESKRFQSGNYIYFDFHTSTQYDNLYKASKLGIKAGILLRCIKFKKKPEELLGYAIINNKNIEIEYSKFYPIEKCKRLKYGAKIPVDNFIKKMRKLVKSHKSKM